MSNPYNHMDFRQTFRERDGTFNGGNASCDSNRMIFSMQNNLPNPLFNPNMMPPGCLPPPNFRIGLNQNPQSTQYFPNGRQHFHGAPPPHFIPGNSSGMVVNPPIPPFLNFPNVPFPSYTNQQFSNSQCVQNIRPEMPRQTLPIRPLPSKTVKPNITMSKTADELLVEQFLTKIGKQQKPTPSQHKPSKSLKICEAKKLHSRAKFLISKLENVMYKSAKSGDSEIQQTKNELKSITSLLSDKEIIKDLQRKVLARRKKRTRSKKLKEKAYTEKLLKEQNREESNKKIAAWQKQEMENLEKKLREEELQKQLDAALLDMRRELTTITKSLDMINSLASLRKARFNSLKDKGKELPSTSATENFSEKVKETKSIMLSYKQSCTKKIDSLKMFLEAEHEQAKREIEKKKAKQQMELKQKLKIERNLVLFGESKELDPFDPMWPVQELHKQAGLSLPGLVQYRRLWDQFLHPDGTTIPVDWVEPAEPSNKEWEKYLKNSNDS